MSRRVQEGDFTESSGSEECGSEERLYEEALLSKEDPETSFKVGRTLISRAYSDMAALSRKKNQGILLTMRNRINAIYMSENVYELTLLMGHMYAVSTKLGFYHNWGMRLLKEAAIQYINNFEENGDEAIRRRVKRSFTNKEIFKHMSVYPEWDFTSDRLRKRAEEDLESYILECTDGRDAPMSRDELKCCESSIDIISLMRKYGWDHLCICFEAGYLDCECACKGQGKFVHQWKSEGNY